MTSMGIEAREAGIGSDGTVWIISHVDLQGDFKGYWL